jgi:hypothetical protein
MPNMRSRLKSGDARSRVRRNQMGWSKPLPKPQNPHGIPSEVMRTLARENLSSDPAAFNRRLQELLAAYKLNGG